MAKSNDEIYDLLVAVDKKVDTHIAVATWRMNKFEEGLGRKWKTRLTYGALVLGWLLGLPLSVIGLVK